MGGGMQSSTQEFKPPSYTQGGWKDYLGAAGQLGQQQYSQYQGMRLAPMNDMQDSGLKFTADRALNGAPDLNAARGMLTDTAKGQYLNSNPYASNPYTDRVIAANAGNMVQASQMGSAAQTDAMAAMKGAFGGSAWSQLQSMNNAALTRQVGQMADQTRQNQTNLGANLYQQERSNQMQAAGLAGQLSQDDWTAGKALTGAGDAYNSYTQKGLDQAYEEWQKQQAWPYQQLSMYGDALSRASGQGGQTMNNMGIPGISPIGGLLGLGAGAYGLSQFLNGGGK